MNKQKSQVMETNSKRKRNRETEGGIGCFFSSLGADGKCYFVFHCLSGRQPKETLSHSLGHRQGKYMQEL